MDRSPFVTSAACAARARGALALALMALTPLAVHLVGQAPTARATRETAAQTAELRALGALISQAPETEPGTYTSVRGAWLPVANRAPVLIQADALRGAENSVRVALALGAVVPEPAVTRVRVVTAAEPRRTVSDVSGTSPAGVVRAVNQLTLAPGDYEVHAAVAHPGPGGVLVSLAKTRLAVPNVWQGGLAVSPLVVGDAVAAAPPVSAGVPFAFGPTSVRPAADPRFSQNGELHVAFRVFNWSAKPDEKPDLQVDYVFHELTPRQAHFFNKVKPQRLNADTIGDRFDRVSGAVNGGMSIPLAAFPPSDFKLTVRVTDTRTKQSASQEVRFAVVP